MLGLGGATEDEKVINLINAVEELKKKVDIPSTLKEVIQVLRESEQWEESCVRQEGRLQQDVDLLPGFLRHWRGGRTSWALVLRLSRLQSA